ncbi:hypothetical protein N3K66_004510 [Trichothecium roseum]|uniref:Uncharacterized protein n=1 Tax=Trichothecium roseum TaxID=47278 RepID=A0ACC0V1F5_9HYPO|nr:hypothetical protein N3K66_004510 [Trichothecium roseum]
MSSFQGRMSEFPDILVDFFRKGQGPPALACFLSHVHSDHLTGLESFRSPFVYYSPATKAMLLNLERKLARINYAEGILEARQRTYKHLSKVLGKAVLYTGDTRSEPWLVDSLARNPALIEYTDAGAASGLKTLDRIYLDTTFARQDAAFPTKAEGVAELLRKVASYPPTPSSTSRRGRTASWGKGPFVLMASERELQIHVDEYKMRVYGSLSAPRPGPGPAAAAAASFGTTLHYSAHGPALVGYMRGNEAQPGCLTTLGKDARVHSCERSCMCQAARGRGVVRIKPVLAHSRDGNGDLAEAALLAGDLDREAEYEQSVYQLLALRNTSSSSSSSWGHRIKGDGRRDDRVPWQPQKAVSPEPKDTRDDDDDDDDDGRGYEYDHQDAARGRDAEYAVSSLPGDYSSTRMGAYYAVLRNGGTGDLNLISTRRPALDAEL